MRIKKVLIANRGEVAVRIIRACKELGIQTVAVYSTIDENQLYAQLADEKVCIGNPTVQASYLNIENIISAGIGMGVDAIHPGYGFLSENIEFAKAVENHGMIFIGPSAQTMELMGDKIRAKQTAKKADVPTVPGSDGAVKNFREAAQIAEEIGYPVLLKAANGGGGRGIREVRSEDEIRDEWNLARQESMSAFGSAELYVEKLIEKPRHIEVQILADSYGNVIHMYERDCSIQRRHQKIIEESPAIGLSEKEREDICHAAIRVAKACEYENAGTVEFLMDKDHNFYFIEMNTRLQVEHTVTEMLTDIDIVVQQLKIASGEKLAYRQEDIRSEGHVIECRITAEDPEKNFAPQPGYLKILQTPGGFNVRFDNGLKNITPISSYYDSMIGKLIIKAENRPQAIRKMKFALEELAFQGVQTNIKVPYVILSDESFQKGTHDTNFLDTELTRLLEEDTIFDHKRFQEEE